MYYVEKNYLIKQKKNKMKLNSSKIFFKAFRVDIVDKLVLIDYDVELTKGNQVEVKDVVYANKI